MLPFHVMDDCLIFLREALTLHLCTENEYLKKKKNKKLLTRPFIYYN